MTQPKDSQQSGSNHKVVYFGGPGDIVNTFRLWAKGVDDPHQQSVTDSGQFYEACHKSNVDLLAISQEPKPDSETIGNITAKNHITLWHHAPGIKYYLGRIIRGLYIFKTCLSYRPNVLFVAEGNTFWFLLVLPKLIGVKIVPVINCVLWLPARKKTLIDRLSDFFDKPIFGRFSYAVLSVSLDITEQVKWVRRREGVSEEAYPPIIEFLPSYRESAVVTELPKPSEPFYALFISRIEADKGIFDLVELAKKIKANNLNIKIDVAGDGSDFASLKETVASSGVADIVELHGYCYKDKMKQLIARSHVFLVMTTNNFIEGLNKVCLESILACRPLIASSACPAIKYMEHASIVVEPGDIAAYFHALNDLCVNTELYVQKSQNAQALHPLFLSDQYSFESALANVINSSRNGFHPEPRLYKESTPIA